MFDRKAYMRDYRLRNKANVKQYNHEYYQTNRDWILPERNAYYKKYRLTHKEQIRVYGKQYHARTTHTRAQKHLALKIAALQHYGNGKPICVRCGFADVRALCLDHINGDGGQHRKTLKGGRDLYMWLKKNNYPPHMQLQVLCYNCNRIKQSEENEWGNRWASKKELTVSKTCLHTH